MAFTKGTFGIEYTADQQGSETPWLAWVVGGVIIVTIISFVITKNSDAQSLEVDVVESPAQVKESVKNLPPAAPPEKIRVSAFDRRPAKVRNLLMRLESAEKAGDTEMAISTIEQLRALPGSPAADLDDALAKRLGTLNLRRLFLLKNGQWVAEVVVKRGDSASRIALEHGSTLASLTKLNGGDVSRIRVGQKLKVMSHPRFNLVVHRLNKTADLSLNGKFFKRYYLTKPVSGDAGAYELSLRTRDFLSDNGIGLKQPDIEELELLLPARTPVLISEL